MRPAYGTQSKTKGSGGPPLQWKGVHHGVSTPVRTDSKAKRWSDSEKATSLLCALDGPARGVLAEVDINCTSYRKVKELLVKPFGPVLLTEVHEQALQDLKLTRTQSIRELTTEVTRLTKLAYPEFDGTARERFAVEALINAINDKDTIFYVKEKNPSLSMRSVFSMNVTKS